MLKIRIHSTRVASWLVFSLRDLTYALSTLPELNASKLTCYSGALLLWQSIKLAPDLVMLSAVSGIGKQESIVNLEMEVTVLSVTSITYVINEL